MNDTYTQERSKPSVPSCQAPADQQLLDIKLTFANQRLELRYGTQLKTYTAISGGTAKNYESIPKGRFWVQPAELWTRGMMTNAKLCLASVVTEKSCSDFIEQHQNAWGDYRLTIHPYPTTDTGGRGGFFIHGGKTYGSAGCIDLAKGMDAFVADLKAALATRPAKCFIDLDVL